MKKSFTILAISTILTACSTQPIHAPNINHSRMVKTEFTKNLPIVKNFNDANTWVNANITYVADKVDYWQSPHETMTRKQGDCEDFAILKKQILVQSGLVNPLEGNVLLVLDNYKGVYHAVLVINEKVLDNQYNHVYSISDSEFSRYTVLAIVNNK